jgi:very-short-patch-repair endonuclease
MRALAAWQGLGDYPHMALLSPEQLERARRLRRMDTGCEQRLWAMLRGRRLDGLKFVRQLPVGPYIADFACREHLLIIKVDGATHGSEADIAYDAARTSFLAAQGWRVLRVLNDDVVRNMEGVTESILQACGTR